RDDDDGTIAAGAGDDGKADAGIAGGALDHEAAGFQLAALFRFEDHLAAGAILHRLAGIHELGLAEDGAASDLGRAAQPDQRRVADSVDDVVTNMHERQSGAGNYQREDAETLKP